MSFSGNIEPAIPPSHEILRVFKWELASRQIESSNQLYHGNQILSIKTHL